MIEDDCLPRRALDDTKADPQPVDDHPHDAMDADEWLDWYNSLDTAYRETHRNHLLCEGLKAGMTLQSLADLHGISRERVRQVTQRAGLNVTQLKAERRERIERRERRMSRRIYGISLSYPELEINEIADLVECDERMVLKGLGNRRGLHVQHESRTDTGRTSLDTLLAALAEWGAQTEHHTGDDYTMWAAERGLPGKQTISIRFGSWNAALDQAGLTTDDRGGLRPQLDDSTLWATLYEFFTTTNGNFSGPAYDSWARNNDRVSLATLRNRLGSWHSMWLRTRELMRYAADRDGSWAWAEEVLDIAPGDVKRRIISQEDCTAALARAAQRFTGPVTAQAYDTHRAPGDPAAVIIQQKCQTWMHALHAAGLTDRMSGKARAKVARGEVILPT